MDPEKRAKLEARGFKVGDAADFLELTDEERVLLDFRMTTTGLVRALRQDQGLTQKEAADRMKTTQPRFAKIEAYAPDVSFDQLLRAYLCLGGTMPKLLKAFAKTHGDHLKLSGKAPAPRSKAAPKVRTEAPAEPLSKPRVPGANRVKAKPKAGRNA